jgi:sorting nexin-1/2
MATDHDRDQPPPADFGADDEPKDDDAMFTSAIAPGTVDISLNDDEEDENPFGDEPPARQKTPTNTTNTVESSVNDESNLFQANTAPVKIDENDDDLFGVNKPTTPAPVSTPSSPKPQLYPPLSADSDAKSTTPDSQVSTPKEAATESKPPLRRSDDDVVEIVVSDPAKAGEGMSSYMTYRITTKTTLSIFKKPEFSVSRRFSDFLGLHAKLVTKHLHTGIFVPSPPEKDAIAMAQVKVSKDDAVPSDFIDRRRALLERYLNRIARNDKLLEDSDVRDFLEMPNDLPKSKDTAALSGAGVLRAFTGISNSVTKLTTKTAEQDQWFQEKQSNIIDLQVHLKHFYNQLNGLFQIRKEAGHQLKQFSTSLNHLATNEEHPSLSNALTELANLEEKLEHINNEHSYKEYSILTELIKEYISLLDMVQLAFNERIKIHHQWLNSEENLKKKRETKTKLEQSPKSADKLPQAEADIREWEGKVEHSKQEFEAISKTIKEEMEVFEQTRIDDFKKAIDDYLKNLIEQQEKILQIWDNYLPEAEKITV